MPLYDANDAGIARAVEELRAGRPVMFPTDTVYGLGVVPAAASSPQTLFEAKGRPQDKPVAWLVDSSLALRRYGKDVPAYAYTLAQHYWPGALTLIVYASDEVPRTFQGEDGSIGLRMPAAPLALKLIAAVDSPLATTSANLSGRPDVAYSSELDPSLVRQFVGLREESINEGPELGENEFQRFAALPSDIASTVVDCRGSAPVVLRAGDIVIS